jgi:hypothetical protein
MSTLLDAGRLTTEAAATMYPDAPPPVVDTPPNAAVAEVREHDGAARKLYSDTSNLGEALVIDLARSINGNPFATKASLERQSVSLAAVFSDMGADRDDIARFAAKAREYRANPPSAEQLKAMHRQVADSMRAEYGESGFDSAMDDARRFAQRDPRFATFLNASGLGDDPTVIKTLARLAKSAKSAGRFK